MAAPSLGTGTPLYESLTSHHLPSQPYNYDFPTLEVTCKMAGSYNGVPVPKDGAAIGYSGGQFQVPDNPSSHSFEGDGTGRDIWKASVRVFDAAVQKAYKGKRRVVWYEVFRRRKSQAQIR